MVGLHPTKAIIETVTDALPFEPSIQQGIQFAQAGRFQHSIVAPLEGDVDATQFGDSCPQLKASSLAFFILIP
ncbi:hypothetical protein ACSTDZ_10670 [Vibrio vulnificus]|uniref:hypothetical protein n=1 Tax=Vibrio vulnificus TaxID=672 RepID=UPI003EDB2F4D